MNGSVENNENDLASIHLPIPVQTAHHCAPETVSKEQLNLCGLFVGNMRLRHYEMVVAGHIRYHRHQKEY